jgi:hypothetical protein
MGVAPLDGLAKLLITRQLNLMGDAEPFSALDKEVLTIAHDFDDSDVMAYWHSRTPHERLRHIETLRRMNYGDRATEGLQRVLEVAEVTWG